MIVYTFALQVALSSLLFSILGVRDTTTLVVSRFERHVLWFSLKVQSDNDCVESSSMMGMIMAPCLLTTVPRACGGAVRGYSIPLKRFDVSKK